MRCRWLVPTFLLGVLILLVGPLPARAQTNGPSLPAIDAGPLAPPEGVKASDCEYRDKIRVTWKGVSGAVQYQVARSTGVGAPLVVICDLRPRLGEPLQCDDATAVPNTPYYYGVRAWLLLGGWTGYSDPDQGIRKGRKPSPPTRVEASDGTYTAYVRVTWTESKDYNRYKVGRGPIRIWPPSIGWETDSSPYDDDTAVCTNRYGYAVQGRDLCGQWSDYSPYNLGYRKESRPGAPRNVQATTCAYPDKVRIKWDSVPCTDYYVLRRHTSPTPLSPTEEVYRGGGTSYDDTGVDPGRVYYYWAFACNDAGCCLLPARSDVSGAACPQPLNVQATDCTYPDKVRVSWDSVPHAKKYRVYRATSLGGSKTKLGDVNSPTTFFDDTTALPNTTYHYWVKACFDSGCTMTSAFSLPNKGKACCDPPDAPSSVEASDGVYPDKVRATWSSVAGATHYEVHRAGSLGGTKTKLGEPTGTWYDDTTCTPATSYYYWVKACDDCGCSDFDTPDPGYCGSMPEDKNYTYVPLVLYH